MYARKGLHGEGTTGRCLSLVPLSVIILFATRVSLSTWTGKTISAHTTTEGERTRVLFQTAESERADYKNGIHEIGLIIPF